MNQDPLFQITTEGEGFFKDRGSKFYAFAYPVRNQEEIEERISAIKKKFHDARHYCYAYRLEEGPFKEFATDDGEPSHSAGDPILGTIRSAQLTWTLIVVVRYFGGTKLGIRGLIDAYRAAAESALSEAPKEEIIAKVVFGIQYAYDKTSLVKRLLHPFELEEVQSSYTDSCYQVFRMREELYPSLYQQFEQLGFVLERIDESD